MNQQSILFSKIDISRLDSANLLIHYFLLNLKEKRKAEVEISSWCNNIAVSLRLAHLIYAQYQITEFRPQNKKESFWLLPEINLWI